MNDHSLPISRRTAIIAASATALAIPAVAAAEGVYDAVVVGAGVFGAWTATRLRDAGQRVLLLDAWGPAHARASSGGESRLIRAAYGADKLYTAMAWESLPHWAALSAREALPLFHRAGVLFFYGHADAPAIAGAVEAHRAIGHPLRTLDGAAIGRRFPQFATSDIAAGLWEPEFGALMARRAVSTLVARFVTAGGVYRRAAVLPPGPAASGRLGAVTLAGGERVSAGRFVFACGPWLGKLFPDVVGPRLFVTRQEVFFFRPPAGGEPWGPDRMPGWGDLGGGPLFYGFPDLEGRGVKIALDDHGAPFEPDTGDRLPSAAALAAARGYLERRFPALGGAPLSEARVCQYENSANGDFLIDCHPALGDVVLVGMGSGHGFKHGPAVGRIAADLALGRGIPDPRFNLASKGLRDSRALS